MTPNTTTEQKISGWRWVFVALPAALAGVIFGATLVSPKKKLLCKGCQHGR